MDFKASSPNVLDVNALNNLESNTSTFEPTGIVYNVPVDKTELEDDTSKDVKHNPTTDLEALIHVLKSSLGTGILAIASGFKNSGMLVGLVGTAIIGFLSAHCTYIMVNCSQEMCRRLDKPFLGYTETVEEVFIHCADKKFRPYSKIAKASVEIFMFITYYGTITAYIILVATSFEAILKHRFNMDLGITTYILLVGIPIYFVGIVRSMKYLAPFSAIANIFLLIGIGITFYYLFDGLPPIDSRPLVAPIKRIPVFFSIVIFGMEGIGTILPIENSMKTPKHFLGCPGVLTIAMSIVVVLYTTVGFFGYLRFGEATNGSITLNLPDNVLAETVKGLVGLAIFFTYGLQLTASMDVVWKRLENRFSPSRKTLGYYCIRSALIVGTIILAMAGGRKLEPVVALIGAVGFSMCGFFYPALVDTLLTWDQGYGCLKWKLFKNLFLCLLAVLGLVTGGLTSIHDIIYPKENE